MKKGEEECDRVTFFATSSSRVAMSFFHSSCKKTGVLSFLIPPLGLSSINSWTVRRYHEVQKRRRENTKTLSECYAFQFQPASSGGRRSRHITEHSCLQVPTQWKNQDEYAEIKSRTSTWDFFRLRYSLDASRDCCALKTRCRLLVIGRKPSGTTNRRFLRSSCLPPETKN